MTPAEIGLFYGVVTYDVGRNGRWLDRTRTPAAAHKSPAVTSSTESELASVG